MSSSEELFHKHLGLVYKIARDAQKLLPNTDLDDAISDGMLALHDATQRYDPTIGKTPFGTYAYHQIKFGISHGYDRRAWKSRRNKTPFKIVGEKALEVLPAPQASLLEDDDLPRVAAAIAKLPYYERKVVELVYVQEMTLNEAGATLGFKRGWAWDKRQKALAFLRKELKVAKCIPKKRHKS